MFRIKKKKKKYLGQTTYYSQKGRSATRRIANTIKKKNWYWTVINLAWTAGPLTVVSLMIGHFMGYGSKPTFALTVYFTTYTAVFGLGALIAGLVRESIYQPKVEEETKALLECINWVSLLIFHARDLSLASLPPKERKVMAAYYTLQSAGRSSEEVRFAMEHLTSNPVLAHAAEQIIVLQEQGLYTMSRQIYREHQKEIEEAENKLKEIAPVTCELLDKWLTGSPPNAREGRPRALGFIQRSLDASEDSDLSLMTLTDAYEVLCLVFELLNDRKISSLHVRFTGDKKLAHAKRNLDAAYKGYRLALRERNSAIRLLLNDIDIADLVDYMPEETRTQENLVTALLDNLRSLPEQHRQPFYKAYYRISLQDQKANKLREKLKKCQAYYQKKLNESQESLSVVLKEKDIRKTGFYIDETSIYLSDEEKLHIVHQIKAFIDEEIRSLSEEHVKEIAAELMSELDQFIGMDNQETQIAIEKSYSVHLGYLKVSYSPAGKVGWVRQVIQSMHVNKKRASHNLVEMLAFLYRIPLEDHIIELFESEFGADADYLQGLAARQKQEDASSSPIHVPGLVQLPPWSEI